MPPEFEKWISLCLVGICGIISVLAYRRRDRGATKQSDKPLPSCIAARWLNRIVRPFLAIVIVTAFFYRGPLLVILHDNIAVRWAGTVLAMLGIALLIWSFRTLDEQYNPCTRAFLPKRIVTTGPYRWLRHPIYFANLLFLLGNFLAIGSAWLAIPLVSFAVLYAVQARREEQALAAEFPEYATYRAQTRWFRA